MKLLGKNAPLCVTIVFVSVGYSRKMWGGTVQI